MSILLQIVVYTIVLPAFLSGSTLVVAWRLTAQDSVDQRWSAAVAIGLGYLAGHVAILGTPLFPPVDTTQWLVYIALAALLLDVIERGRTDKPWPIWGVRFAFLAAMGWFLLRPLIAYSWSTIESVASIAGLMVVGLALWAVVEQINKYAPPQLVGLLLIALGTAESIAIVFSQSAVLAQLQGVLTSTIGAAVVLAWLFPQMRVTFAAATSVITTLLVAHAAGAFFYAQLPAWSAACLGLAPLIAWIVWRRRDGATAKAAGLACALVACAIAVWVAIGHAP